MDLRREHRQEVVTWGRYRRGVGKSTPVEVFNLSEYGCQFRGLWGLLQPNNFLTLRIGNIGPLDAHVVWSDKTTAGVQFNTPIDPSVLGHIINESGKGLKEVS